MWAQGLRLYKQARFAAACPLLAQAAASAPENGAIWADLGLCELKRGDQTASIHASLLAARFGDERVRKHAYFNLFSAGYTVDIGEECAVLPEIPKELACSAQAFACRGEWRAYGSASGTDGSQAVFASSIEEAQALREDIAGSESGAGAVGLSERQACFYGWCQLHGWRCDDSALVERRGNACFQKALGRPPKDPCRQPGADCDTYQRCQQQACDAADDAVAGTPGAKPWPAVIREHDEREANCMSNCVEGETLSCSVVVVDPCQNRIGYVCTETEPKTQRARTQAGEVAFTP